MIARKENKEYTVDANTKAVYLNDGYDIYDDNGEIIEYSPKKQVPISEFISLKEEKENLEKQLEELQANPSGDKELVKANKALEKQVKELTEANSELVTQVENLTDAKTALEEQVKELTENGESNGEIQE